MSEIHMKATVLLTDNVVMGYIKSSDRELFIFNLLDTNEIDYDKWREVREHVNAVRECLEEQSNDKRFR